MCVFKFKKINLLLKYNLFLIISHAPNLEIIYNLGLFFNVIKSAWKFPLNTFVVGDHLISIKIIIRYKICFVISLHTLNLLEIEHNWGSLWSAWSNQLENLFKKCLMFVGKFLFWCHRKFFYKLHLGKKPHQG